MASMNEYLARLKAKIREKPIPQELTKLSKPPFVSFVSDQDREVFGIDKLPEPNPAEIEERKGMAADSVPESYLDAWARLQCQKPMRVSDAQWRQAINDAGRFLDQWGKLADSFGWSPGDLFDVPRDGAMGLAWWLQGKTVNAFGPEHACAGDAAYDRVTRREWFNPYTRPVRPVSLSPILERQQKIMQRVLGR
jgi:hypothetical protein